MAAALLTLLGGFRLDDEAGIEVRLPSRNAQALLAVVGVASPQRVRRERIAGLLWPDLSEDRARHNLRQLLSGLRRRAPLLIDGEHVALDAARCTIDAAEFRALAASNGADAERALQLYSGPLLDGFAGGRQGFEAWLREERSRLSQAAADLCRRTAAAMEAQGRREEAAYVAQRWLALDPGCEEAHVALMRLHAKAGRRSAALQQYEACRDALRQYLDAQPRPETVALHEEIRAIGSGGHHPAIAVLPALNLARTVEAAALGAALAEDLSAQLARLPGFEAIAPQAVSAAAGEAGPDLRRIARTVRAKYLLASSLRQVDAELVRVAIQIVEGESAQYLWSTQADLAAAAHQRELDAFVASTVAKVEQQLNLAETRSRSARPGARDAWDRVRQASSTLFARGWSREAVLEAVQQYREAIALDPALALARAQKALVLALAARWGIVQGSELLDEARADAECALAMEPGSSEVLGYAGCALADLGDPARALPLLERAVAENPANAQAWAALGSTQLLLRRLEEGIASLQRGLRISATDYRRSVWQTALAGGLMRLKRLEEALESARDACRSDANFYPARLVLAGILVKMHRPADASKAFAEARRLQPLLRLDQVRLWAAGRSLDGLMGVG